MDVSSRIERALSEAVAFAEIPGCPPRLAAAMRYAVFPRGARVRPRLCHSVAAACGEDHPAATEAAGAALELLHCASLVHDDLPCFDAAETRRGRPSVHKAFGEPLAVLTGDALIVLAFQTLARIQGRPERLTALTLTIAQSVGVPSGIVAGQAWECESQIDLAHYHRAKTGALFAAATVAGAASAGAAACAGRMRFRRKRWPWWRRRIAGKAAAQGCARSPWRAAPQSASKAQARRNASRIPHGSRPRQARRLQPAPRAFPPASG